MINVINSGTTSILFMLMMLVFVFNLKFAFIYTVDEYLRDFEYWMVYENVEPARERFEEDEIIEMISSRIVHRDVKTTWIDVLYCKRNNDETFKRFSQSTTGGTIMREAEYKESNWLYAGRQPQVQSTCYMISDIILSPSVLVNKVHTVQSKPFEIHSSKQTRNRGLLGG